MQGAEFPTEVKSPFNLPTYQRRLRHLHSIAVRNLYCPQDQDVNLNKLQVYFTLHKDEKEKSFYTSEKIIGSLNPTWQSFDLLRCDAEIDGTTKFLVLRIWFVYEQKSKVAIMAQVHLSGLVFFSSKLQVPGVKYPPNTLLFGMFNNIFIHYDVSTASPQLSQWILDKVVPTDSFPPVVKVDQSSLKPSYNINYLSRIHTVQRAIKQTQASVKRIHSDIEDKLLTSNESSDKLSYREVLLMKVRQLRKELLWQTQQKQCEQEELDKYKVQQNGRSNNLKEKRLQLQKMLKDTEEKRTMHIQSREMLVKENAQVLFRRKQIINEMVHYIYPITQDDKQNFFIHGVRLPNAEDYHGQDEIRLSVALGFTCHLTQMVSHFMDMPLRYPMVHRGSRSTIIDHIHSKLTEKDREFPLYGKGKEKFQYNYAVFLLNKNISQLRFYCGLGTNDLRQTLPNLKSLLEQRLGVRSHSSEPRGNTQTLQSPQPTSVGESLTSRRSQVASSDASSYARKDFVSDLEASDSTVKTSGILPSEMENSNTFLETIEQRTFETVSTSHNGQDNGTEFQGFTHQNSSDMEGSSCKDYAEYSHHKNGHTVHEVHDKKKDGHHSRRVIEEEDETEELFQPSDDHFFQVNSQPGVQEFNSLLAESLNHSHILSANFGSDINTNGTIPSSDILNDNNFRSFKLLKAQGASQAGADKQVLESGQSGGDHHQSTITEQVDNGFSPLTDTGLYSHQEKP
ncbi:UV radiation resistance-associated protein-like [Physella acuta]|uniref:UV radiation resistance-associated protein-like n=1 Tax=Physella acuta TaxID=109671 RepID=UPI0027DC3ED4|nr:UV radiation resistance-associated protein-like [Physella acuta]